MAKMMIRRGSDKQLAPHFTESEFYSTSPRAGFPCPDSHPFYSQLIVAAEILRTHYNTPWRITSTFRTPDHELKICRDMGKGEEYAQALSKTSQHVSGHAFDSQPVSNHAEIVADLAYEFLHRGPLFQKLLKAGITGFGIYDWGIHLDCRVNPTKKADGLYSFWDERDEVKAVKKKPEGLSKTTLNPMKTPAALVVPASPSLRQQLS